MTFDREEGHSHGHQSGGGGEEGHVPEVKNDAAAPVYTLSSSSLHEAKTACEGAEEFRPRSECLRSLQQEDSSVGADRTSRRRFSAEGRRSLGRDESSSPSSPSSPPPRSLSMPQHFRRPSRIPPGAKKGKTGSKETLEEEANVGRQSSAEGRRQSGRRLEEGAPRGGKERRNEGSSLKKKREIRRSRRRTPPPPPRGKLGVIMSESFLPCFSRKGFAEGGGEGCDYFLHRLGRALSGRAFWKQVGR